MKLASYSLAGALEIAISFLTGTLGETELDNSREICEQRSGAKIPGVTRNGS